MKNRIVCLTLAAVVLALFACRAVPAHDGGDRVAGAFYPGSYLPADAGLGATVAGNDAGTWSVLKPGTNGQVLSLVSGTPAWVVNNGGLPAANFGAFPYYGDAGAWAALDAGSPGQFLQTAGLAGNPQWVTISGADEGTFFSPPLAGTWTNVNFGTFTTLTDFGIGSATPTVVLQDFRSGGANTARCSYQARPGSVGAAYTLTAAIRQLQFPANNSGAGIAVSDGTKLIVWQLVYVSGGVAMQIDDRTNQTTTSANAYSASWNVGQNARFWLRIQNDGTYRFFTYSSDGQFYLPVSQMQDAGTLPACNGTGSYCYQTNTTFINNAETRGGICINPESSTGAGVTLESWSFTSP